MILLVLNQNSKMNYSLLIMWLNWWSTLFSSSFAYSINFINSILVLVIFPKILINLSLKLIFVFDIDRGVDIGTLSTSGEELVEKYALSFVVADTHL